jgi:uncharacterized protein YceK
LDWIVKLRLLSLAIVAALALSGCALVKKQSDGESSDEISESGGIDDEFGGSDASGGSSVSAPSKNSPMAEARSTRSL